MNIKNYADYACFDYKSKKVLRHKLGDVVIKKDKDEDTGATTHEIGIIIQVHEGEEEEYRTDKFGNCSLSEIRLATKKEIKKYRPNILNEGKFKSKKTCS